jgi:hypothetical protein
MAADVLVALRCVTVVETLAVSSTVACVACVGRVFSVVQIIIPIVVLILIATKKKVATIPAISKWVAATIVAAIGK